MSSLEEYYRERLYPIQDGVFKIVRDLNLPFYLTGGTALSRFYFNHRYSDDLDFFVNENPNFKVGIEILDATERFGKSDIANINIENLAEVLE